MRSDVVIAARSGKPILTTKTSDTEDLLLVANALRRPGLRRHAVEQRFWTAAALSGWTTLSSTGFFDGRAVRHLRHHRCGSLSSSATP